MSLVRILTASGWCTGAIGPLKTRAFHYTRRVRLRDDNPSTNEDFVQPPPSVRREDGSIDPEKFEKALGFRPQDFAHSLSLGERTTASAPLNLETLWGKGPSFLTPDDVSVDTVSVIASKRHPYLKRVFLFLAFLMGCAYGRKQLAQYNNFRVAMAYKEMEQRVRAEYGDTSGDCPITRKILQLSKLKVSGINAP